MSKGAWALPARLPGLRATTSASAAMLLRTMSKAKDLVNGSLSREWAAI
jgi:hypothetical protein